MILGKVVDISTEKLLSFKHNCIACLEKTGSYIPANRKHSHKVGSMLAHRLRRWSNIEPTLGECLVFAGMPCLYGAHVNTRKADSHVGLYMCHLITRYIEAMLVWCWPSVAEDGPTRASVGWLSPVRWDGQDGQAYELIRLGPMCVKHVKIRNK